MKPAPSSLRQSIAALGIGLLCGLPGVSSACSCITNDFQTNFERKQVVLIGRVVRQLPNGNQTVKVELDSVQRLKGDGPIPTHVFNGDSNDTCAYHFTDGEKYIVLTDSAMTTHLCFGNAPLKRTSDQDLTKIIEWARKQRQAKQ